jgi:hypothetical protein
VRISKPEEKGESISNIRDALVIHLKRLRLKVEKDLFVHLRHQGAGNVYALTETT